MLNNHPQIGVPYEAHIYNVFWQRRHRYEPLDNPERQRELVEDILAMHVFRDWHRPPTADKVMERVTRGGFHGVFEAVLRAWADGQNKPRWGEKTPHNGDYWRIIHAGFPDAQFVHMVRDGRDCALSMIRARFGPKLAYTAALQWSRYIDQMQSMKRELGPEKVYEIRYIDLVNDTEGTLRLLCGFLGESYHPAMLSYHTASGDYTTDIHNAANLKKPVLKHNTRKWATHMTLRDQRVFEAVAGDRLALYGYPVVYPGATIAGWERLYYKYILHPPLRLFAMLRNTKGCADSLIRFRVLTTRAFKHPRGCKPSRV